LPDTIYELVLHLAGFKFSANQINRFTRPAALTICAPMIRAALDTVAPNVEDFDPVGVSIGDAHPTSSRCANWNGLC
jgi:hypothetical protein